MATMTENEKILSDYKVYLENIPGFDNEKEIAQLGVLLDEKKELLKSFYLGYISNSQNELISFAHWLFIFKLDIIDKISE